jgi:hypothetical protein
MPQICPSCGFIDDTVPDPNAVDTSTCPACGAAMLPDVDGLDFDLDSAFDESQPDASDAHSETGAESEFDDAFESGFESKSEPELESEVPSFEMEAGEMVAGAAAQASPEGAKEKKVTQKPAGGPADPVKLPFEMVSESAAKTKKPKGLVARLINGVALAAGLLLGLSVLQLACWWILGLDPLKAAFVLPDSLAFIAPAKLTPSGIEAKMREPIRNLAADNNPSMDDESMDDEDPEDGEEELTTPPETPESLMADATEESVEDQPSEDPSVATDLAAGGAGPPGVESTDPTETPTETPMEQEDSDLAANAALSPEMEGAVGAPPSDDSAVDTLASDSETTSPADPVEDPSTADFAADTAENDMSMAENDLTAAADEPEEMLGSDDPLMPPAGADDLLSDAGNQEPAADDSIFGDETNTTDTTDVLQVGPASARPISRNDLAAANVRAAEAMDTLANAQADRAGKDDIKQKARDAYVALAELGMAAALADPTGDGVNEVLTRSFEILQGVASQENWRRMVGTSAAGWMKSGKGEGVIAAGEVTAARPSEGYWEIDLQTLGKPVTLTCVVPTGSLPNMEDIATVGNQVTLFGWLAKNPQQSIRGYNGDATEVIWSLHMIAGE